MKPLVLEPIPDYTIWGGDTISTFRKADKNYGTWWEVSAHPYCTNKIKGEEKHFSNISMKIPKNA